MTLLQGTWYHFTLAFRGYPACKSLNVQEIPHICLDTGELQTGQWEIFDDPDSRWPVMCAYGFSIKPTKLPLLTIKSFKLGKFVNASADNPLRLWTIPNVVFSVGA